MGAWALESSRQHSYKDLSEMMFESLKHPETGIPEKSVPAAQRSLHAVMWNNLSYFCTAIEQHIGPGCHFEVPTRWTKRAALASALAGDVIDATSTVTGNTSIDDPSGDQARSTKKRAKTVQPLSQRIVANDRAFTWLLALDHKAKDKLEKKSKGKSKKLVKSPATIDDDELSLLFFKPKTSDNPVNLATYARVLDSMDDPLPTKLLFAHEDEELLSNVLKYAKSHADSLLRIPNPSPPLKLIIRTPVPWSDFAGNGPQDLVNVWHPAAILEDAVIALYRKDFIAGPIGGFIRQNLEECLCKYIINGTDDLFDWPDGLTNLSQLDEYAEFDTPLAKMELDIARYRQSAHAELQRVMAVVQNSFVATNSPVQNKLETKVPALSTISKDMDQALGTLYTVR